MKNFLVPAFTFVLLSQLAEAQSDARFVREAAIAHMAEIKLGRMAQDRGISAFVRNHGKMMVDDHQMALNELKALAAKRNMRLPSEIDAKHKAIYRKLSMLNGTRFDNAYRAAMVKGHTAVLKLMRAEAKSGQVQAYREYAMMQAPIVERHLFHAKEGTADAHR